MKLFQIELPVGPLKTAVAGLNKVIGRSQPPVLRCVRLTRDGTGAVTLEATDLDSVVRFHMPGSFPGSAGMVLIPWESLTKVVKANKQKVGFATEAANQLVIQSFIGSIGFEEPVETPPLEEWPVIAPLKGEWVAAPETFRKAFADAQECASTDASRFILNGVCLDLTPDGHYVVATDGRHLYSANSFSFDLEEPVIVPTRKFLAWSGFLDDGQWRYRVDSSKTGWIEFQSDHWSCATKLIEGTYPNWKQVVPTSDAPLTVATGPEESLARLLETVPRLPVSDRDNRSVTLSVANGTFTIKSRANPALGWTELPVLGTEISGPDVSVALNRDLLVKALRLRLGRIELRDPLTPVVFRDDGRCMVIAPLRASAEDISPAPAEQREPAPVPPAEALPGEASTPSEAPLQPRTESERNTEMVTSNQPEERASTRTVRSTDSTNPLKETAHRLESLRQGIKDLMADVNQAMSHLKAAERDQKNSEKEIESVRSTLRSLQKVQI